MAFTAKDVAALRERTGSGMMDCKQALTEANGDMDKAIEILREKGLAAAAKKAGRIAAEGIVYATVDDSKKVGVIIEVNSETDFVAKNENFTKFVEDCAKAVIESNPADVETLVNTKIGDKTVQEELSELTLKIGEKMDVRRFERYEGNLISYIHGGGRIGVLVKFDVDDAIAKKDGFVTYAKDIAMQIAAANPTYVNKEDVPADVLDNEKKILTAQAMNEGKPQNIAEKMVQGRIGKFYKEICLVEQPFVKDGDISVAKYTENVGKELGGAIKIVSFVRYEKGEGIEKRSDNLAEEVAAMTQK